MLHGSWRTTAIAGLILVAVLAIFALVLAGAITFDQAMVALPVIASMLTAAGFAVARDDKVSSEESGAKPRFKE